MRKILDAFKKAKANKGFTLVELIIVIAIIAILAAILAPQYVRFIEDSRESNDVALAASIEDAVNTFVADGTLGVDAIVSWDIQDGEIDVVATGENSETPAADEDTFYAQLNVEGQAGLVCESYNAKNDSNLTNDTMYFIVHEDATGIVVVVPYDATDAATRDRVNYTLWSD